MDNPIPADRPGFLFLEVLRDFPQSEAKGCSFIISPLAIHKYLTIAALRNFQFRSLILFWSLRDFPQSEAKGRSIIVSPPSIQKKPLMQSLQNQHPESNSR
jgi:hypothetical protein